MRIDNKSMEIVSSNLQSKSIQLDEKLGHIKQLGNGEAPCQRSINVWIRLNSLYVTGPNVIIVESKCVYYITTMK